MERAGDRRGHGGRRDSVVRNELAEGADREPRLREAAGHRAGAPRALGFPPELWFEENLDPDGGAKAESGHEIRGIDKKVSHLFGLMGSNSEGKPYTDAEVARLGFGDLTEEDVEAIRTGKRPDPSVDQIVALADVFGVDPAYFLERAKNPPLLDSEAMEIFRDETVSAIAHKSLHLPGRERQMVLNIIRQFEQMQESTDEGGDEG